MDDLKKRLHSIYSDALNLIHKNLEPKIKEELTVDLKEKATLTIILKLFNDYEEVSNNFITSIVQENSKLKSELRIVQSIFDILLEKSQEIIYLDKSLLENSIVVTHKRGTPIEELAKELNPNEESPFKVQNTILNHNLNVIRDQFNELIEKNDLQKNLISSLKEKARLEKQEREAINLIAQVPKWMPDDYITHCMKCEKIFNMNRWKHHCRVCGNIFCSTCCSHFDIFEPFYMTAVRTCVECHNSKRFEKYKY